MSRNMFWNFDLLISFKMRIKFDRMCKYCFFILINIFKK